MDKESKYLKRILKQIFNYADLKFKQKIEIKEDPDINMFLPSIALGVNILGDELEFHIKAIKKANSELQLANENLEKANEKLNESIEKLTKLNAEKETLLQEVHHRVKNNLQVISGLVTMQYKRTPSEVAKTELKDAQGRINSIAMLHEGFYRTNDFTVNIADYCREMSQNIGALYGSGRPVEIKLNLYDGLFMDIKKATNLGLIINELICNCYKHYVNKTSSHRSTIWISLKKTLDIYHLEVKNSMDDLRVGESSLGNKLIKNLSKSLNADVTTTIDDFYSVTISFS